MSCFCYKSHGKAAPELLRVSAIIAMQSCFVLIVRAFHTLGDDDDHREENYYEAMHHSFWSHFELLYSSCSWPYGYCGELWCERIAAADGRGALFQSSFAVKYIQRERQRATYEIHNVSLQYSRLLNVYSEGRRRRF